MDFPNFRTLFQIARNEALVRNPQLTQDAIDREGSDANILIASAVAAADEVVGQQITVTSGLFLDSASGDALDRLLFDRYGLVRKVASAAVGSVAFSTTVANPSPFTIPSGTQLSTSEGLKFETVGSMLFPAGTTGPIYVTVRSLLAGANQQAAINTINSLVGTVPSSPVDLVVTNPIATAGASDRESDTEFRERGRSFYTTVQRGTLSAITQGALSVPGVVSASTYEFLDSSGLPNKRVACVIADKYTDALANYTVVPPVYEAQSKVLAQQVFNALEAYRPAGVFVQVQLAQVVPLPVSLALSFKAGVDIDVTANAARAAIANYINNLQPGDDLYLQPMIQVLQGVEGLIVTGDEVVSPPSTGGSTDPLVVTTPLQVLRSSLALVRASSSNPATPIGLYLNPDQA